MAISKEITNLVINKVESQAVYDYMVENDLVNDDELYLVQGTDEGLFADDELSSTSESPVQNKVIKAKFDSIESSYETKGDAQAKLDEAKEYADTVATSKQDKLTGISGQYVGFDANGNAIAQDHENGMILNNIALEAPFYFYPNVFTAYGNGRFVAIKGQSGNYTDIAYSNDGMTWTVVNMQISAQWRTVAYGNGVFVAISYSSDIAAYSTDGINWTQTTMPATSTWCSVAYGNGKFVAVSGDSSSKNIAAYSTDGINWTQTTMPATSTWRSVTYGNGKFVAHDKDINGSMCVAYTDDGITWHNVSGYVNVINANSITYGNDKFVIVGNNKFAYSTDCITWSVFDFPVSAFGIYAIYGCDKFVVGCNDCILYSVDGTTWEQAVVPIEESWNALAYGNNMFVAMGSDSRSMVYSYDGITWYDCKNYISQNGEDVTRSTFGALGASPVSHAHDDRYYTKSEVDALIASAIQAAIGNAIGGSY